MYIVMIMNSTELKADKKAESEELKMITEKLNLDPEMVLNNCKPIIDFIKINQS